MTTQSRRALVSNPINGLEYLRNYLLNFLDILDVHRLEDGTVEVTFWTIHTLFYLLEAPIIVHGQEYAIVPYFNQGKRTQNKVIFSENSIKIKLFGNRLDELIIADCKQYLGRPDAFHTLRSIKDYTILELSGFSEDEVKFQRSRLGFSGNLYDMMFSAIDFTKGFYHYAQEILAKSSKMFRLFQITEAVAKENHALYSPEEASTACESIDYSKLLNAPASDFFGRTNNRAFFKMVRQKGVALASKKSVKSSGTCKAFGSYKEVHREQFVAEYLKQGDVTGCLSTSFETMKHSRLSANKLLRNNKKHVGIDNNRSFTKQDQPSSQKTKITYSQKASINRQRAIEVLGEDVDFRKLSKDEIEEYKKRLKAARIREKNKRQRERRRRKKKEIKEIEKATQNGV